MAVFEIMSSTVLLLLGLQCCVIIF